MSNTNILQHAGPQQTPDLTTHFHDLIQDRPLQCVSVTAQGARCWVTIGKLEMAGAQTTARQIKAGTDVATLRTLVHELVDFPCCNSPHCKLTDKNEVKQTAIYRKWIAEARDLKRSKTLKSDPAETAPDLEGTAETSTPASPRLNSNPSSEAQNAPPAKPSSTNSITDAAYDIERALPRPIKGLVSTFLATVAAWTEYLLWWW